MKVTMALAFCFLFNFVYSQSENIISVQLKNSFSGVGVPGVVWVTLGEKADSFITNSNGAVQITVPNGKIHVRFLSDNFTMQESAYIINKNTQLNLIVSLDPVKYPDIKNRSKQTIITGYVTDSRTLQPIKGASVKLQEYKMNVLTNKDGYFELIFPVLTIYDDNRLKTLKRFKLVVSKPNYKQIEYKNILAFEGGMLLKISMNTGRGIVTNNVQQKLIDNPKEKMTEEELKNIHYEPAKDSSVSFFTCTSGTTIRVYHGDNNGPCTGCKTCTVIEQMSLEQYVRSGLDNEWIASWNAESLKAGAVAYRTYGAYHIVHPYGPNYDITAYPCRQHWEGNVVVASTVNATNATANQVLVMGPGNVAFCEYAAETNNFCTNGDCYSGHTGYWPCIKDTVCCGKTSSGHGRGMCQWGSKRWGDGGKDYKWILDHYYTPGGFLLCL